MSKSIVYVVYVYIHLRKTVLEQKRAQVHCDDDEKNLFDSWSNLSVEQLWMHSRTFSFLAFV